MRARKSRFQAGIGQKLEMKSMDIELCSLKGNAKVGVL